MMGHRISMKFNFRGKKDDSFARHKQVLLSRVHRAAETGDVETLKVILAAPGFVYRPNFDDDPFALRRTLWHYAGALLNADVLKVLCKEEHKCTCIREYIDCPDSLNRTPLHHVLLHQSIAAQFSVQAKSGSRGGKIITQSKRQKTGGGDVWKVTNTAKLGLDEEQKAMIYQCSRILILGGASVTNSAVDIENDGSTRRRSRRTSFICATGNRSLPIHFAASANLPKVVRLLCMHGSPTSTPDHLNRTPLHLACWAGSVACVRTLLEFNSSPNMKNDAGRTPIAVASVYGHIGVIRAVMQETSTCPDIDAANNDGQTPLMLAVKDKFYDCAIQMVDLGADPFKTDHSGSSPILLCTEHCPNFVLKVCV
jgi:hypothetical protein